MKYSSVPAYIAAAPPKARTMLRQLRATIRRVAPTAEERISYGMPYYGLNGRLAYFAAFRDHVSFFVMARARSRPALARAMAKYRTGTATLRFPLGSRIPSALIERLLRERLRELRDR